ncbi:MAG: hypothetical protein E7108_01900 [Bacteroidales bacterium]|jgi:hypothetical protein|nr:hypothetical protein [Bacteroidales bacterium]
MRFRPHILRYQVNAQGHDDENGNFVSDVAASMSEPIQCRWIPNGSGSTLSLPDENGGVQVYSYRIVLDLQMHDFHYGDVIYWVDVNGQILETKKVLKHHRYQLYEQIWV